MGEYEVGDETIDITPPDYMVEAAEAAEEAQEEGLVPGECGTGVGDRRADQISGDEVGPDVVEEVASYLTSHEEDVTAEGHPRSWSEEEWSDCGNAQAAKWGDSGDERSREWAQRKANEVAEARDEDIPYPNIRGSQITNYTMSLENPEYEIGDFLMWEFGDGESQGEVVDRKSEVGDSMSAGGNEFTIEEGDGPLYKLQEWDESEEDFTDMVVKFEDTLSSADRPEDAPETAPANRDRRDVNQLSSDKLREIKDKAGTDEAPKIQRRITPDPKDIKQGEDEEGNPVYKVPISGDARDRDGDKMTLEGQDHMIKQLRTGKVKLFGDHGRSADDPRYSFKNILGQFIDGERSAIQNEEMNEGEEVTMATLRLDMAHPDAERLSHQLENDFPVGFSVGFRPLEVEEMTNDEGELVGLKMLKVDLMEASAVGIPSQPDSVPVAIENQNTEAAMAVKSVLDEKGATVDSEELKDALEKTINNEDSEMTEDNTEPDQEDQPDQEDVLENAPEWAKTLKDSLDKQEKFNEDEVLEIVGVVGENIDAHMDQAMDDIAEDLMEDDSEEDEMDEDEEDEDEEENGSEPEEEDSEGEEEENSGEGDEDKGLDEEDKTDTSDSQGPKGSGPMTNDGDKDVDESDAVPDEGLSDEELEDLAFGRRV